MKRLLSLLFLALISSASAAPNVVVIFIDDMGYADIGPFGAKGYATPNLDAMAAAGTKFTNFHVAQPVCSASRAAMLTGCYPNRIGISGALSPGAQHGIHTNEVTLGEIAKQKGYATCAIGKWHLGHHQPFLPQQHGFDHYLGLPYSNDMWPFHPGAKRGTFPKLPLIEDNEIIDADVTAEDQVPLTTRYTERAVRFIEDSKGKPFLLYLAHNQCHVPLFVSDKFKGKSERGLFGDVIMDLDWSVCQVMDALKRTGVHDDTLVIFTSDNGPWLTYGNHAGSADPLREGKGSCWEGGVRVPCLMQWPGHVPAGATNDTMLMTIDVLPTVAKLLDAKLPDHRIDGLDVSPVILGQPGAKNPHEHYFFYYANNELQAVTSADGRWKLQLPHNALSAPKAERGDEGKPGKTHMVKLEEAELYDLKADVSESRNVRAEHSDVTAAMEAAAEAMRKDLGDSITKTKPTGNREAGKL